MGNYRQHLTAASLTGVAYAWAAHAWAGVHWLYGSVAALLATLGGLLPDLDHPGGVEIRGVATLLGTLGGLIAWKRLRRDDAELPVEAQLWVVLFAYLALRVGSKRVLSRLMVHRGMSHSLPTCAVWGTLTYLVYPSDYHPVRVAMAAGMMLGFLSHLVLDELFSVDLKGTRLKKSFGTALKFWAPSLFGTVVVYGMLYALVREVVRVWPEGPVLATLAEPVPEPVLPPLPRLPEGWQAALPWRARHDAGRAGGRTAAALRAGAGPTIEADAAPPRARIDVPKTAGRPYDRRDAQGPRRPRLLRRRARPRIGPRPGRRPG